MPIVSTDEQETVALFREFMRDHADAAQRELAIGHLTGAAWHREC